MVWEPPLRVGRVDLVAEVREAVRAAATLSDAPVEVSLAARAATKNVTIAPNTTTPVSITLP